MLIWRRREQVHGKRIGHARVQFPPPDKPATGTLSRRLQHLSKNQVDFGCFSKTSVKSASRGNCRRTNALAPEVAHHQSVHDCAEIAFGSRRLRLRSPFGELRLDKPCQTTRALPHAKSVSPKHLPSSLKCEGGPLLQLAVLSAVRSRRLSYFSTTARLVSVPVSNNRIAASSAAGLRCI